MELLCGEEHCINRAFEDPVLLKDSRVLLTLLETEEKYLPSSSYFKCVQTDIKEFMRKIVASWMLEVCEEMQREEEVFPLAMNLLDRFLSVVDIKKTQLQLLGASCMFISSKLKETRPFTGEMLVLYTDNSITLDDLMDCELLVLNRLKWDVSAITPHDFLEQLLSRLPVTDQHSPTVKRHAQTFIAIAATDFQFASCPPSVVASGSVCAAAAGLLGPAWVAHSRLLACIHTITNIDVDVLRACQDQIEQALSTQVPSNPQLTPHNSSHPAGLSSKCENGGQPTTPTDVRDIHY